MSKISFTTPAANWYEALPLGNGRLGAMVYGKVGVEEIQLNEETVWYGGPRDRINPEAYPHLQEVRKLIKDGQIPQAQTLLRRTFSGMPQSQYPYQPLGSVKLRILNEAQETADYGRVLNLKEGAQKEFYERHLDLSDAVYHQTYEFHAQRAHRRAYISSPDQVMVYELSYEQTPISLEVLLTRERFYRDVRPVGDDTILMQGKCGDGGVTFLCAIKAVAGAGRIYVSGENLIVEDAGSVMLLIAAETTYEDVLLGKAEDVEAAKKRLLARLSAAAAKGSDALLAAHGKEYHSYVDRVSLSLPGAKDAERFFDYGRYLLLSSSRNCKLPANLQGIWNEEMAPSWDSKYTININTEMNYWPAEVCGLPECHLVLMEHIRRVCANGRHTAEKMYHCRGSVAHHNTDLWGDSAPQDLWIPGTYWVMGLAWLCQHIGVHYRYSGDAAFLAEYLPILEEAVLFFADFTTVGANGEVIISPSVSPENTYILPGGVKGSVCENSTMDVSILRELLTIYLEAQQVLQAPSTVAYREGQSLTEKAKEMLSRLPQLRIGSHGQIMEWQEDYEEAEPGHRHVSQLFGLFPGREIDREETPQLAAAAEQTLARRLANGGGHTGWSAAWLTLFYVELGKPEEAWDMLQKLLTEATAPNLMDTHPRGDSYVFQIDGNLGACAAIARMIVRCKGKDVYLLSALPAQMQDGEARGLRLYGNASIDLTWKDGIVTGAVLHADADYDGVIHVNGTKIAVEMQKGMRQIIS